MGRRGSKRPAHEDQFGTVESQDRHDGHGGHHSGGGRAGGAAGGGVKGADVTFQRALPKFLAPHAHLLGVGTAPNRAAAGDDDADAEFEAADTRDAVAAALRDDASLAAAHPELAAAAARARGDEAKEKGNAAYKKGDWAAAVTHFSAAVAAVGSDSPDTAVYLANRAAAHGASKNWAAAFEDATTAARVRPGWPKAWVRVGEAATALRRWSDATAAYERAVALQPDDDQLQIALARARGAETRAVAEGKVTFQRQGEAKRPRPIAGAAAPPPKKAAVLSFAQEEDDDEDA